MSTPHNGLLDAAANLYADTRARQFARNKLRFDPVFADLLREGRLPGRGTLLDLGCGQGLLLALLAAARAEFERGVWPAGWPHPPQLVLKGVEIDGARAAAAQAALRDRAEVTVGDVRDAVFPVCSVILLLDVLMYLPENDQRKVLEKAVAALDPGGTLLMREADAGGGLAFRVTRWSERLLELARGQLSNRLHYRSEARWTALLAQLGLSVTAVRMSAGTPFANILFVCTKRDE